MAVRNAVQQAYGDWLAQFRWQWFCTLTFRDPPHPETAEKRFGYWVHRLNQTLYGRRYKRHHQGIYWVLALEYHKSGVIHFHALLGDQEDLNVRLLRIDAAALWVELAGFAKIDPIDEKLVAVTRYVSKYVTKGGDLTLSDTLSSYAEQDTGIDRTGRATVRPVTVTGTERR